MQNHNPPVPTPAATPTMRFAGLAGAIVAVYPARLGYLRWECEGCGDHNGPVAEPSARKAANGHASTCRALPQIHRKSGEAS